MQLATIQTATGREDLLRQYLNTITEPGLIAEVFIPRREVLIRLQGRWVRREESLMPGYLFVDTADAAALYQELKRIPMFTKLLGDRELTYQTLTPAEEDFIRRIGAERGDHTFGVSQVRIDSGQPYQKGDHVTIVSGDLKDFAGEIVGFDLHKRKAMVRSALFGGSIIHVGIEILRKED